MTISISDGLCVAAVAALAWVMWRLVVPPDPPRRTKEKPS